VLNASRHHRKNRDRVSPNLRRVYLCSTPRGITGKIAHISGTVWSLERGAQRLAASPEKSLFNFSAFTLSSACSTPRGITGKIAGVKFPPPSGPQRAQRLAASPEKSRWREHGAC